MTKLIAAAPSAPIRRNADQASLASYLLGSCIFVAGLIGLFAVAGFSM